MAGKIVTTPTAPSNEAAFTTNHPSVQPFMNLPPPAFLARHFPPANSSVMRPPAPTFLATGAIVFNRPVPRAAGASAANKAAVEEAAEAQEQPPRVLLVQRAAHDSMPLRWETPGGGCDDDDASLLHSCARELQEEAGLSAAAVGPLIRCGGRDTHGPPSPGQRGEPEPERGEWMGGHYFLTRKGKLVCKFYFVVEVAPEQTPLVVTDPDEHAGYIWATEEEVRNKMRENDGRALSFTTREQWEAVLEAFKLWK